MYGAAQSLILAVQSIVSRLGRSFLTTLGIIISVASVIAMVSVIQGLSHAITRNFEGMGSKVLTIQSDTPFDDRMQGRLNRLTMGDYRMIRRQFAQVGQIIPSFAPFGLFGARVTSAGRTAQTRVIAVTSTYKDALGVFPARGRFVSDSDNLWAHKVCVIGERLRKNLRLPEDPVGRYIEVNGFVLEIVGLMEPRGELLGISQDDYVAIPFAVGERLMPNNAQQDITVLIDVDDQARLNDTQADISAALRQAHHLSRGQDDDFTVQTAQQLMRSVSRVTDIVTLVLGGVVGISLLVGGIGIMNIMLVSVTERTREVGICKALGAQRHMILLQFLFEATILSVFGGVVGIFVGWLIGWVMTLFMPVLPTPVIPLWAVMLALAFSSLVGLAFGVAPAAKAADLDPIEALRFEG